jgi:hypothetical protein
MKKSILPLLIITIQIFACSKQATSNALPICVSEAIVQLKKNKQAENSIINAYTFQAKKVYLIDDGMSYLDGQSKVVDGNCNTLGYLGGMLGNTKINGEDFFATAILVETVWKK